MGKWLKQQEEQKNRIEKNKIRKEKLADFFFSLANTVFGSLVIGVTLMMLQTNIDYNECSVRVMLVAGMILFTTLARIGNNILK